MADDDTLIDEYVNGLPRYPGKSSRGYGVRQTGYYDNSNDDTVPLNTPQVGRSVTITRGKLTALVGVTFLLGGLAASCGRASTIAAAEPTPARTVTVTQTVKLPGETKPLPESCTEALRLMEETMPAQSAIMSQGNKHLDLLSEGYRALLSKDPNELNRVVEKQRKERANLAPHIYGLMDKRARMLDLTDQCNTELKN